MNATDRYDLEEALRNPVTRHEALMAGWIETLKAERREMESDMEEMEKWEEMVVLEVQAAYVLVYTLVLH